MKMMDLAICATSQPQAAAALGWGIYSLKGRGAKDPLALTAANFVISVPIVALLLFDAPFETTPAGAALAIFSGAVTSGLGYALWYAILPSLGATRAAVAQLSAPVIAARTTDDRWVIADGEGAINGLPNI